MTREIIIAGFGGQGVMAIGKTLTEAGLAENLHVSWLPSYGPEMRGGTANCCVIVSDEPVGSPVVTEADAVIVLNKPSLDKFERTLKPGGILLVNSSLIDKKASRSDVKAYYVSANEIATEVGNAKVANVVMLGAYIAASGIVQKESIIKAVAHMLGERKAHLVPLNEQAYDAGAKSI